MEKQTFGTMITVLRKERGMTQLELADKMGVTDKAVSKWERDLSLPDAASIPKLAEIFQITTDELMQVNTEPKARPGNRRLSQLADLALKGVALAMGVAVVVLSALHAIEPEGAVGMLGIGLACLAVTQLSKQED